MDIWRHEHVFVRHARVGMYGGFILPRVLNINMLKLEDLGCFGCSRPVLFPQGNDFFFGGLVINKYGLCRPFGPHFVKCVFFGLFQHSDILAQMVLSVNKKRATHGGRSPGASSLGATPSTIWYCYQSVT